MIERFARAYPNPKRKKKNAAKAQYEGDPTVPWTQAWSAIQWGGLVPGRDDVPHYPVTSAYFINSSVFMPTAHKPSSTAARRTKVRHRIDQGRDPAGRDRAACFGGDQLCHYD